MYVVHNIVIFFCLILSFWSLDIVLIDRLIVYDLSIWQISHLLLFLVLFENSSIHCKPCNENRVFPVKFSHREIPVMKRGVPAMRTGVPCNENRLFPVWKTSQGKPVLALYWPCTGLQCCTDIPQFILLKWGHKIKTEEAKTT